MAGAGAKFTKSIMIVYPENLKVDKQFGAIHGFKFCMGACYLNGYI